MTKQSTRISQKGNGKGREKRRIAARGCPYYLREKTWLKIKDQKATESYAMWEGRLAIYGFSVDDVDLYTGEQHYAAPKIEAFDFSELSLTRCLLYNDKWSKSK